MLRKNFDALGQSEKAEKTLIFGLLFIFLIIGFFIVCVQHDKNLGSTIPLLNGVLGFYLGGFKNLTQREQ
jgi:hypothetical protein